MAQIGFVPRSVPGAELLFGESVAHYLADISDESYGEESESTGFLLGKVYRDSAGEYAIVSGVTQDPTKTMNAVGLFRSSLSGFDANDGDVRRAVSLFGSARIYMIIVDAVQGAMCMYVVENGIARKVRSAMVENL